ncbi:hypothetical protein CLU96_1412 [Chryseobacterium sp. 52]|uniref:bacteriocin-like protein n=1 Tax=Chryseobacterium sp. 52 TaxID=2035213 RepID=UPI000C173F49|nr:hypothetical protein CLU96_1412 [Chryseobacterium sp. 52]
MNDFFYYFRIHNPKKIIVTMKNLKKIARKQLMEVQGGVLPGMKRCLDAVTCENRIWYAATALDSPCSPTLPICMTDLMPPTE